MFTVIFFGLVILFDAACVGVIFSQKLRDIMVTFLNMVFAPVKRTTYRFN
ncbi:MAG: hypothetical protein MJ094_01440 [Saccharofermentans sp.]|nr:hypothetical protein [Saccharofermentans sp.]